MSMLDRLWTFCEEFAVTGTGDTDGTDTIDIGRTTPKIGGGTPLWANAVVHTGFTGTSASCTLLAKLETGAANTIGTTVVTGNAVLRANCTAGKVLLSIPLPSEDLLRHVGMVFTVGHSAIATGTVDAWIGTSPIYDP